MVELFFTLRMTHCACILLKTGKYNCTNIYPAIDVTCQYLRSSKKTNQTRFKRVSLFNLIPDVLLCNFYALTLFSSATIIIIVMPHVNLGVYNNICCDLNATYCHLRQFVLGMHLLILMPVIQVHNKPCYM